LTHRNIKTQVARQTDRGWAEEENDSATHRERKKGVEADRIVKKVYGYNY